MPSARELNPKIADVSVGWHGFLADVHRMLNEVETATAIQSVINTLAVPSPHITPQQRIDWAVRALDQIQRQSRESIQKLRTHLTI